MRSLIGRPDPLPAKAAERFPELLRARYRRGGLLPRIGGWCLGTRSVSGITLWRTIWLDDRVGWDIGLLLHEIRHVHQFESTPAFPIRYIWETIRRGYEANRFEVDARGFSARRLQRSVAPSPSEDV